MVIKHFLTFCNFLFAAGARATGPTPSSSNSRNQTVKARQIEQMELQVQELKVRCRAFFVRAIREIQARFVLDDKIYEISELLQPKNAHSNVPSSLAELFVRFPSLKECCDIQNADEEWRALRNLSPSVFGLNTIDEVKQLSVESYWSIIFSLKTVTNTPRFLNLKPCISLIFSLPTSNAAAESQFCQVDKNRSPQLLDQRNFG